MKNHRKKYRRILFKGVNLISESPVLSAGLALPFVIVPSVSLKAGLAISAVVAVATISCALVAPLINPRIPVWLRAPLYSMMSAIVLTLAVPLLPISPVMIDNLGIYIPLACVNTIMLTLTVTRPHLTVLGALSGALGVCFGFTVFVGLLSAFREVLSARTLAGLPVELLPLRVPGASIPFFGFIVLSFLCAMLRSLNRDVKRMLIGRKVEGSDS